MRFLAGGGPVLLWLRLMGLAVLPALLALAWPPLGAFLRILAPAPLAYGAARRGVLEGVLAVSLVSLAMRFLPGGAEAGFGFWLETAPMVAAVVWVLKSRLPLHLPALGGAVLVVLVSLAGVVLPATMAGIGPMELFSETEAALDEMLKAPAAEEADPAKAAEAARQMDQFRGIWRRFFLGIAVSSVLLMILFLAALVRGVLAARGHTPPPGKPFLAGWSLPWPFVGAFILLAAGALFLPAGLVREAAGNALLPLAALYGIQGAAVAGHLLGVWKVPPAGRLLVLLLAVLMVPLALMALFVLAGLFDIWFDFRRRFAPRATPPQADA